MAATPIPAKARHATLSLERSLPLTRLPALLADQGHDGDVVLLDGLPFHRFSPAMVDQVLRPAIDEIVDGVVAEIDQWFDAPIRGGSLERNIRLAADNALRQFLEAVASGRAQLDRSLFRDLGRKHARVGFPLSELTGIFNRGGLACWRGMLRLHRSGELPDDLLEPASEIVFVFAQELCAAAVEGYTEALGSAGTAVRSQRVELVRLLVSGDPPELSEAQVKAEAVGWPLPRRLAVAVTTPRDDVGREFSWPREVLGAPHGTQWCLLLPADGDTVRVPDLPKQARVAVGPVVDWTEARTSLEVAEHLLALASDGVVAAPGPVLHAGAFGADLALARDPAIAQEMVRTYLGPLLEMPEHRRCPLLETIAAWVRRPGQHTAIAEELCVSVRTVRYRMDRLREVLGDLVDDVDQRLELALAIRALDSCDEPRVIVLDEEPASSDASMPVP